MFGDKLYQQRARQTLPILVRQAWSEMPITYARLAQELGMPNARNLNYVLGSVGQTLVELGQSMGRTIPPIQTLVYNKATGVPGEGIDHFLGSTNLVEPLTARQREQLFRVKCADVFAFSDWIAVLRKLDLEPLDRKSEPPLELARRFGGTGEGIRHRELKESIAQNPELVGLPRSFAPGEVEFNLPSGDAIDVLFRKDSLWIAIEVKPVDAPISDLQRGMFQCVKYKAVLQAWRSYEGENADVRLLLALEGPLPISLVPLRNSLGTEICDSVGKRLARG